MYHADARKNQEGEAKPWMAKSAVDTLKPAYMDYKSKAQQVSGLKDAQHDKTYLGPDSGSKAAQTGYNNDFEGMRY